MVVENHDPSYYDDILYGFYTYNETLAYYLSLIFKHPKLSLSDITEHLWKPILYFRFPLRHLPTFLHSTRHFFRYQ